MPFEPLKFLINQVKTAVGNLSNLETPQPDVVTALNAHTDQIANVATVITSTTNNSGHAISSGEYFIANGAKYKASATIDTGATWSDKSISVSDHDLINALNSKLTQISEKTGNPDVDGLMSLSINIFSGKIVVGAYQDGSGVHNICTPLIFSNVWHVKITDSQSGSPVATPNQTVKYVWVQT